jgi:hypothetical protein
MKLTTYQEESIKLEIAQDYKTDALTIQYTTTSNSKPVVLGTFEHDGYIVSDKQPIILTLTEQGMKMLSVLAPERKPTLVNAVVRDHLSENSNA